MEFPFTFVLEQSEGWWVAEVPEIPGAYSQGKTPEEAMEMALSAARDIALDRRESLLEEKPQANVRQIMFVA